jgi:thioredoxin 1
LFNIKITQITSDKEFDKAVENTENLVVCAGRWGPMCIPVYGEMERLEKEPTYDNVSFRVVDFDSQPAGKIKNLSECKNFRGLPFTVYYKNGRVVHATSSIQSKQQLEDNIAKYLMID